MCKGPEVRRETDIFKEQKEGQYEQDVMSEEESSIRQIQSCKSSVKSLDFIPNTMEIPRDFK